jgi:hypothetical protein
MSAAATWKTTNAPIQAKNKINAIARNANLMRAPSDRQSYHASIKTVWRVRLREGLRGQIPMSTTYRGLAILDGWFEGWIFTTGLSV